MLSRRQDLSCRRTQCSGFMVTGMYLRTPSGLWSAWPKYVHVTWVCVCLLCARACGLLAWLNLYTLICTHFVLCVLDLAGVRQ